MLERFIDFVILSATLTLGSSVLASITGVNFWFCVLIMWLLLETIGYQFYLALKETIKSWFRKD
jgi:hypothetical protein